MGLDVFVEIGSKKAFAGVIGWPGWCRSGRNEEAALQALLDCGPRYAGVLGRTGVALEPPADLSAFSIVERLAGNATTDFGAPDAALSSDTRPVNEAELARFQAVLDACWQAFDQAVEAAIGRELRKGPRGGGRELDQIMRHVLQADVSYLARLAWRFKPNETAAWRDEISRCRQAAREALAAACRGDMPAQGPRGGKLWTPRFFVRRVAWHALDHAWEIEDRIC
jgi:hypothetical protein